MAEQPFGSTAVTQYGARQPDGTEVDYGADKDGAAEAATMAGCEMVTRQAWYSPWVAIPNPLEGHSDPSGS